MKRDSYILPFIAVILSIINLILVLYRLHLEIQEGERKQCNLLERVAGCVEKIKAKV